jgi:hypothetical protein
VTQKIFKVKEDLTMNKESKEMPKNEKIASPTDVNNQVTGK